MRVAQTRPFDEVAHAVASRYRRGAHYYVRSKLRIDPVARSLYELAAAEPFGHVADLACGRGQFAIQLLAAGLAESVTGIDWDEDKVRIASDAAGDLAAKFEHGDVREATIAEVDTVMLIDVLHYLTAQEQDALLRRAAKAARRRVVVRDVDPSRGASSALTQGWEWITTTLGYNRGERVSPRSFDDLAAILESEGFRVTREVCSAKGLSNMLMVGRRRSL